MNNYILLGCRSINHPEQYLGGFPMVTDAKAHFENTLLMFTKKASGRIINKHLDTMCIYANYLQDDGDWRYEWRNTQ